MNNKVNIGKDLYLKGRIGWRGLSKDEYLEHSLYRIINATALLDNKINWDNCGYISQERFDESKEIILQEDDILISKDGTLGKIGFVKNKPRFATVASGIFVLRNTKKDILDTTYLYHFLKSNIFKDFIKRNKANGSTINHLYQRDLVRLDLDLPSIKGQQRIGSILSNIDEKIELNNKINAELENIAKTLYDYWFVQFDFPDENARPYKSSGGKMVYNNILKKEIPEIFNIKTLQDIVQISTEQIIPQKGVKYNYYSIPTYDEIKTYQIEDGENIQSNKFIVKNNDVLISKLNPRFNRVIGVQNITNGISSTELIVFRCLTKELQSLIYNIAKSDHFKQYCIYNATGSSGSHNRIAPEIMSAYKIPYNDEVINKFNKLIVPLTQKQMQIIQETRELISLREFLLPMLMNGQVTVSDKIEDNLSEEKIIEKSLEFWETHGKMDIDKFARENGILVYKDNEQKKGAVSYNAEKDLYEIAVKDPRDNFTIAHEIGHILKHKKELKTGTLGRKSEESGSKIMEYEADFLAAEILMPEEYVLQYMQNENKTDTEFLDEKFIKSCAKNFDVTPPAMNIRLKNLGYKVPYLK